MPLLLLFPSAPFIYLNNTATIVVFFPLLNYIWLGSSVVHSPLFIGFFHWQFPRDLSPNCHAVCVPRRQFWSSSRNICAWWLHLLWTSWITLLKEVGLLVWCFLIWDLHGGRGIVVENLLQVFLWLVLFVASMWVFVPRAKNLSFAPELMLLLFPSDDWRWSFPKVLILGLVWSSCCIAGTLAVCWADVAVAARSLLVVWHCCFCCTGDDTAPSQRCHLDYYCRHGLLRSCWGLFLLRMVVLFLNLGGYCKHKYSVQSITGVDGTEIFLQDRSVRCCGYSPIPLKIWYISRSVPLHRMSQGC